MLRVLISLKFSKTQAHAGVALSYTRFLVKVELGGEVMTKIRAFWWKPYLDLTTFTNYFQGFPNLPPLKIFSHNYGDALNDMLLSKVLGEDSFLWRPQELCDFTGIGSVLNTVIRRSRASGVVVWGSGLRHELESDQDFSGTGRLRYLALRGKFSASALKCSSDVVFGDPGLLVAILAKSTVEKRVDLLFIPHFSFLFKKESKKILMALRQRGFEIIYPFDDVNEISNRIGQSRLVVSSAMHALISADALGVPAIRLVDESDQESEFKFRDYASGINDRSGWPKISLRDFLASDTVDLNLKSQASERILELSPDIASCRDGLLQSVSEWNASR